MSTLVLRATKGSPLTNTEVDTNFSNLNTDKLESTYSGALNSLTGGTSIATVGTVTAGTWNASVIAGQYGGTGVANTGKTITLGGNFTTSGAFTTTLTATANTSVTLPTTGTLVNTAVTTLSSLASIGTVTTGTWNGSVIGAAYGGTGVANNAAATVTSSGNFAYTRTLTASTNVTFPTTGTLATLAGAESLTNKTMGSGSAWNGTAISLTYGGTGATSASGARTALALSSSDNVTFSTIGIGSAPAGDFRALIYWDSTSTPISGGLTFADMGTTGTANQIRFTKNSTVTGTIQSNNTNVNYTTGTGGNGLYGVDATSIALYSNNTERIRVTSSGGVSFGATGTAYGTSGQLLQSNGNAAPTWVTPSYATTGKAIAMAMVFGG